MGHKVSIFMANQIKQKFTAAADLVVCVTVRNERKTSRRLNYHCITKHRWATIIYQQERRVISSHSINPPANRKQIPAPYHVSCLISHILKSISLPYEAYMSHRIPRLSCVAGENVNSCISFRKPVFEFPFSSVRSSRVCPVVWCVRETVPVALFMYKHNSPIPSSPSSSFLPLQTHIACKFISLGRVTRSMSKQITWHLILPSCSRLVDPG